MKANVFTDSFSHTLTLKIKFDGEDMAEYEDTYEWMEWIASNINEREKAYLDGLSPKEMEKLKYAEEHHRDALKKLAD